MTAVPSDEFPDHDATPDGRYRDPGLSPREEQVLIAWMNCDTKTEVSRTLFIALGTVNTHLSRVRKKYDAVERPATTKATLVARALQDGLVQLDDL